ncbi:hypothetical protein F4677DRAFT_462904 [Hypoxylon crocopeplum]|nr:hypothetical protein F4677DRAFT_462904 [Hypoxylon crocopeplum]
MASATLSSTASSTPIPFEDPEPLALELQPPPLRLPQRKPDANFDGSNSLHNLDSSSIEDPFISTTPPLSLDPPPQSAITKALSQRRAPAPKLGSLVSKFEILDAVSSADTSSLPKTRPSAIPRAQGVLRQQSRATEPPQQITSTDKHSAARYSNISPRQVASPPPTSSRSKLPVSTLFKSTTVNADADVDVEDSHLSQRKDEETSTKEREQELDSQISPSRWLKDDDPDQAPSHSITSQTGRHPG